ncbi:hypothetical protein C8J56DRAFT_1067010 [Mycena floridula]|nr:hypothetical protein C8J56DRAFT_1067010 [Mycena floridula]
MARTILSKIRATSQMATTSSLRRRQRNLSTSFRNLNKGHCIEIANLSTSSKLGVLASLMGKQASSLRDADPAQMSLAIQKAFENLDSEILKAPLRVLAENMDAESRKLNKIPDISQNPLALQTMLPAISGSCALLAVFDTTRDCCAVAGVWEPSADGTGAWRVDVLSEDQTGRNPKEPERIRKLYILSFLDTAEALSLWESTELVSVALSPRHDASKHYLLAGTVFPRISSPTIIPRRNVKIHIDDFLAVISKHFRNLRTLCLMDMHQALIWTPPRVPSCIQSSSDLPFEDVVACLCSGEQQFGCKATAKSYPFSGEDVSGDIGPLWTIFPACFYIFAIDHFPRYSSCCLVTPAILILKFTILILSYPPTILSCLVTLL